MKVYVITKGEYSSYHICAVTLDKNKAKSLKEKFSNELWGNAVIEIFDTDNEEEVLKYENVYACYYLEEKSAIKVSASDFDYYRPKDSIVKKYRDGLYTYVLANTLEDALKIASDKFAKYRAEKMGL